MLEVLWGPLTIKTTLRLCFPVIGLPTTNNIDRIRLLR